MGKRWLFLLLLLAKQVIVKAYYASPARRLKYGVNSLAGSSKKHFQLHSKPPNDYGLPDEDASISPPSSADRMKEKLLKESQYPLKMPLLYTSAVLGGKGLTDVLLTVAKVSAGMRGASFSEEFLGVPILAIDFVIIGAGLALGTWTWKTMR